MWTAVIPSVGEAQMLELFFGIYIGIGFLLAAVGPVAQRISKEVKDARGTPLSNFVMKREQPSEVKLLFFRIAISIGFIILWPFFIWGIIKDHKDRNTMSDNLKEKSNGLWFSYMGGHGTVICQDCDHSEEVTSFIHGFDASSSGFQCQGCGKFSSISSEELAKANQLPKNLLCECGGNLEREKVIFCPNCKSKNLIYEMQYIT